jgi:HSP20 family protein
MALVKYGPMPRPIGVDRLASEIFGQSIGRLFGSDGSLEHAPRVNILEGKEAYTVQVQAPGFDKKDLKVEMVEDTLTIRGEHTEEENREDVRSTRREFERTAFERSFVLPQSVQSDAIRAEYVNGVLQLTIPKTEESKPRTRSIIIG